MVGRFLNRLSAGAGRGSRTPKGRNRRILRPSMVIPKTSIIIDFAAPCRVWALRSVTFGIVRSPPVGHNLGTSLRPAKNFVAVHALERARDSGLDVGRRGQ